MHANLFIFERTPASETFAAAAAFTAARSRKHSIIRKQPSVRTFATRGENRLRLKNLPLPGIVDRIRAPIIVHVNSAQRFGRQNRIFGGQ